MHAAAAIQDSPLQVGGLRRPAPGGRCCVEIQLRPLLKSGGLCAPASRSLVGIVTDGPRVRVGFPLVADAPVVDCAQDPGGPGPVDRSA